MGRGEEGAGELVGAKANHWEQIVDFSMTDPAAKFWHSLVNRVHKTPEGYAGLTSAEQTYFAVCLLEGEVHNGGFDQYFTNSSADYYSQAVDGLRQLGAAQSLKLLLEAKEVLFGSGPVPSTQSDRFAVLPRVAKSHSAPPDWSDRLDAIDKRFWVDQDRLIERLETFAEEHALY